MPGNRDSMYYSFNMGPIHFVAISTEFYFYVEYGFTQLMVQYDWLINDLKVRLDIRNFRKLLWSSVFPNFTYGLARA